MNTQKKQVYFLHGFMGQASDWSFVDKILEEDKFDFHYINLWKDSGGPQQSLNSWVQGFVNTMTEDSILVGYSLGGRLALHVLLESEHLNSKAIICSAYPKSPNEAEVAEKQKFNDKWTNLINTKSEAETLALWNSQKLFSQQAEALSTEFPTSKENLIAALNNWSIDSHYITDQELVGLEGRVEWVVGEKDQKYLEIFTEMKDQGLIKSFLSLAEAGHRAPWDNRGIFLEQLQLFLGKFS